MTVEDLFEKLKEIEDFFKKDNEGIVRTSIYRKNNTAYIEFKIIKNDISKMV